MIIGGNESAMNLRGDEVFFATFRERGANLSEHLACELPRIPLLRLSEKVFGQRSKREFGRQAEHEISAKKDLLGIP